MGQVFLGQRYGIDVHYPLIVEKSKVKGMKRTNQGCLFLIHYQFPEGSVHYP